MTIDDKGRWVLEDTQSFTPSDIKNCVYSGNYTPLDSITSEDLVWEFKENPLHDKGV